MKIITYFGIVILLTTSINLQAQRQHKPKQKMQVFILGDDGKMIQHEANADDLKRIRQAQRKMYGEPKMMYGNRRPHGVAVQAGREFPEGEQPDLDNEPPEGAIMMGGGMFGPEDMENMIDKDAIMAYLKKNLPEVYKGLKDKLDDEDEEMAALFHIAEAQDRYDDPKLVNASIKAFWIEWQIIPALLDKYNETKNEKMKQAIKAKLSKKLNEVFEARLQTGAYELKELEKEMENLQKRISKRKKNKEKIVAKRLEELLEDADEDLHWW